MKASESLQNDQSTATEKALRLAFDTTPAFIHTARPDGYFDYFNRCWLDFLGKSLEDVCGWRWTESVHPEDVGGIVQKWRAALATWEPFVAEARVRCGDGTYRAFLHRKVPLHDEQGNIAKWFGSSIDIEDRKRAEKRRPLEAELQATLNVIPAYTWYALPSGALTCVNERTADYLGIPKDHPLRFGIDMGAEWDSHIPLLHPDDHEETRRVWSTCLGTGCAGEVSFRVRKYWSEECYRVQGFDPRDGLPRFEELFQRIHPDDQPKLKELMERMVREKIEFETDYRLVHPGGAVRDIHSTVHPVLSPSGDLIEFMGTVIDVTERKRAEEELRSFWLPIPSLKCLTPPAIVWVCCVGVLIL